MESKSLISATANDLKEEKEAIMARLTEIGGAKIQATLSSTYDKSNPHLDVILHKLEHTSQGRDTSYVQGAYMKHLKEASGNGAWRDALRIYQSMVSRGFFPNDIVFMYMIVACKLAEVRNTEDFLLDAYLLHIIASSSSCCQ